MNFISLATLYMRVLAACTPAPPLNLLAWAVCLDGQLIAEPNYQLEP